MRLGRVLGSHLAPLSSIPARRGASQSGARFRLIGYGPNSESLMPADSGVHRDSTGSGPLGVLPGVTDVSGQRALDQRGNTVRDEVPEALTIGSTLVARKLNGQ